MTKKETPTRFSGGCFLLFLSNNITTFWAQSIDNAPLKAYNKDIKKRGAQNETY